MADKTINTLDTELVSVGANDLIGVWDVAAAQYKKAKRSNLVGATITGGGTVALGGFTLTVPATGTAALIGTANTFTPEQIMTGGIGVGVAGSSLFRPTAGVVRQELEQYALAADALLTLSVDNLGRALVYINDRSDGKTALIWVENGAGTLIFGDSTYFTGAVGTDNRLNVYGFSNGVYVQNTFSGAKVVSCFVIG